MEGTEIYRVTATPATAYGGRLDGMWLQARLQACSPTVSRRGGSSSCSAGMMPTKPPASGIVAVATPTWAVERHGRCTRAGSARAVCV